MHIHIARDDLECKFWLEPVALARNFGFPGLELNKLAELVETNKVTLIESWNEVHG